MSESSSYRGSWRCPGDGETRPHQTVHYTGQQHHIPLPCGAPSAIVSRERVLTAEGEKKAYTLQSEGVKIQLINESEGHLIEIQNQARANKERIKLEAEVSCLPGILPRRKPLRQWSSIGQSSEDAANARAFRPCTGVPKPRGKTIMAEYSSFYHDGL